MPKQSASYDRAEYDPHPVGITAILLLVSIAAERSDAPVLALDARALQRENERDCENATPRRSRVER